MWVAVTLHSDSMVMAFKHSPVYPFTRTHCALTRNEDVLSPLVVLPGHVLVMAAYGFHIGFERRDFS